MRPDTPERRGIFATQKIAAGVTVDVSPVLVFPTRESEGSVPADYTFMARQGQRNSFHANTRVGTLFWTNESESPETSFLVGSRKYVQSMEEIRMSLGKGTFQLSPSATLRYAISRQTRNYA